MNKCLTSACFLINAAFLPLCARVPVKSLQFCPTLCNPMYHSPPDSSVHGVLQTRILELPYPPPGNLPDPGIEPTVLYAEPLGKPHVFAVTIT